MDQELQARLERLQPKAIAWVRSQSDFLARSPKGLMPPALRIATAVGVTHPERIRVIVTKSFPSPDDMELATAIAEFEVLTPQTVGMTFGYGIYIRSDQELNLQLLAHECRHVKQYEEYGVEGFIVRYLSQIAAVGYPNAELEVDARAHEWCASAAGG